MPELEPLVNLGVGGVMAAAAVYIIRWYANLASTGEDTWSTRLDQLQENYEKDRARWDRERETHDAQMEAQRTRHDREMEAMRMEMARDREECSAEIAALRTRVDELGG